MSKDTHDANDEKDCEVCTAIAHRVQKQAEHDVYDLLTKMLTSEDRDHMPPSIIMANYLQEAIQAFATAIKIEVQESVENGEPLNDAVERFPASISTLMEIVGHAFGVEVATRAMSAAEMRKMDAFEKANLKPQTHPTNKKIH